jgi:hypothetical protein
MKNVFRLIGTLLILTLLNSCYYDKEDQLYPSSGICDTSIPATYTAVIVPMLQQYCYSCHGGTATLGGGIPMGTYSSDKAMALNGSLYGSITHASSYSAMPKGGNKLTACQLAKVKQWIDGGSLNN